MIYISAQPDLFYFTWQLELQIFNFSSLGVKPESIHILIAYNSKIGVLHYVKKFISNNIEKARFFLYPDTRRSKKYPSSIRPHILAKHYKNNPWLSNAVVFYHDSDIIFRSLPSCDALIGVKDVFVSDTRSYLNLNYIKSCGGEQLIYQMCELLKVDPNKIFANDDNCGGAQYIFKDVSSSFWQQIEITSERLFEYLTVFNRNKKYGFQKEIQSWCADMWCMLWILTDKGYNITISRDLEFCWAGSDSKEWFSKNILHYTGSPLKKKELYFDKTKFINHSPYFDDTIRKVSKKYAGYYLVKLVDEFNKERAKANFNDVSFLFFFSDDCFKESDNIKLTVNYILAYAHTNIIIGTSMQMKAYLKKCLPKSVQFVVFDGTLNRSAYAKINNALIGNCKSPIIALWRNTLIIPISQIEKAVKYIRNQQAMFVKPFIGVSYRVDNLLKAIFKKVLDAEFFDVNRNKCFREDHFSLNSALIVNRNEFLKVGKENERCKYPNVVAKERNKRIDILGYKLKRINGPAFTLPEVSNTSNSLTCYAYAELEYLKVCSMERKDLKKYINGWSN